MNWSAGNNYPVEWRVVPYRSHLRPRPVTHCVGIQNRSTSATRILGYNGQVRKQSTTSMQSQQASLFGKALLFGQMFWSTSNRTGWYPFALLDVFSLIFSFLLVLDAYLHIDRRRIIQRGWASKSSSFIVSPEGWEGFLVSWMRVGSTRQRVNTLLLSY